MLKWLNLRSVTISGKLVARIRYIVSSIPHFLFKSFEIICTGNSKFEVCANARILITARPMLIPLQASLGLAILSDPLT